VIRSPYDRYVSQYHYGWWKTHPQEYCDPEVIIREFPSYPQVDFDDFVMVANRFFVNVHRGVSNGYESPKLPPDLALGWHSEQFIRFFCREPHRAFASIVEQDLQRGRLDDYEYPVKFLRTETLNRDLAEYLEHHDVDEELLHKVRTHRRVMPEEAHETRQRPDAREYFDRRLIDYVRRKEAFLFSRFPEYRMEVS
jgi:hypothetical protein